jgi:AraC family transcriptional regulator of adaptative response/methylated-DNA-[protein]-cysteine methyltransferase
MQRAYLERDPRYDGVFILAVRTTGIFCRPTCSARKPLPANVEYFSNPKEALFAGYRPCKRCRPLEVDDAPVWAQTLLEEVERQPMLRLRDRDLEARGIDPATVRRHFLRRYGMTFQAFTRARRLSSALARIREGAALNDVVFDSGYESHSGFRDAFVHAFGHAPRAAGAEGVRLGWFRSPVGPLVAGATSDGVCLLEFTDRRMLEAQFTAIRRRFEGPIVPGTNDHLTRLEVELRQYFDGVLRDFTVPLVYPGTDFQRRVWEELLRIPYGETRSYEAIAAALGTAHAVRAVGRANGLNRIAIVIPCHRVVRKDGHLCGYGGGLPRKKFLLDLERSSAHQTAFTGFGLDDGDR